MQRLIIIILSIAITCSCKNQKSLIGNWDTTSVSFHDYMSKSNFTIYDRNNQDVVKEMLLKKYLEQKGDDSSGLKEKLDKDFLKYNSSNLILETDSSFFMKSFGIIIPTTEPGWHFGDTLAGKWTHYGNNTLKLEIGDIGINHPFFFKINKLTYDSLNISMTDESYMNPYINIQFVRH